MSRLLVFFLVLYLTVEGGGEHTVWDDEDEAREAYLEESEDAEDEPSGAAPGEA